MIKDDKINALIIGGSSGLGLELGLLLAKRYNIFITGRKDPRKKQLRFISLEIKNPHLLSDDLDRVFTHIGAVDLLIYAAGFYQDGAISDLEDGDITAMINIKLTAPAMMLQRILQRQKKLSGFIAITSTSQSIPRLREPMYAAANAGLCMLARSVSLDNKRVVKTLVVAPAGMKTSFWKGKAREGALLEPRWVAERIIDLYKGKFAYKQACILREPPRVKMMYNKNL
ncbi:MAG: SDR family NAD(P)-dependent oxidoreductase [Candidatus Azambacteria bacterium]|nr:SDR family NAD(P)-dependent oxidoreductase [Candidatus Azambacteria bacterium]